MPRADQATAANTADAANEVYVSAASADGSPSWRASEVSIPDDLGERFVAKPRYDVAVLSADTPA